MAFQIMAQNIHTLSKPFPQLDEPITDRAEAVELLKDFIRLDGGGKIDYFIEKV
jgi:hypothetical protein